MRAGLNTILQTLTPEAAGVLNLSVAEAAKRGHGQTTPLHVAATLLASPTGLLRQACVRSHPATSHPLQCRALELCFSVALDRLPSSNASAVAAGPSSDSSGSSGTAPSKYGEHAGAVAGGGVEKPPISNALMAALKRAQANQRRGCPEQQQQPLLAVKVELGQLVISILDDPGVSRVMREASFSSPAVKATIEQSLLTSGGCSSSSVPSPSPSVPNNPLAPSGSGTGGILGGLGILPARAAPGTPFLPANRSLYLNPRLQQQQKQQLGSSSAGDMVGQQRNETQKVHDILLRTRKRNPILIGESQLEDLMKEVLQKIEKREFVDERLRNVEVISLDKQLASTNKSQIPQKLQELVTTVDARFKYAAGAVDGVILDLGDLKWLVGGMGISSAQQNQQASAETGRAIVSEMTKLLSRFEDGGGSRVWLVGRANSATYVRCQVNYPTIEADWDLQAVPVAPRMPLLGALSRPENHGVVGKSLESLTHHQSFLPNEAATLPARHPPPENSDPSPKEMCPVCKDSYEHELANLVAKEFEKSSSECKVDTRQSLPPWLLIAKLGNGASKPTATRLQTKEQELMWKQTTEELLKRWTETCSRLHPHVRQTATILDAPGLCNSSLQLRQAAQTKLLPGRCSSPLRVSNDGGPTTSLAARPISPPGCLIRTDLALGRAKPSLPQQSVEKFPCKQLAEPVGLVQNRSAAGEWKEKTGGSLDFDSFKRLFRGLTEKVSWQPEAATAVAATVMQCKSVAGKRRGSGGPRGDTWLLFSGPDKVGKRLMAAALSEMVVGCVPVTVRFGIPPADGDVSSRGKTVLDRVVETVRRDPFSVVVLENVDRADALVVGHLMRAMERGRITDSHGREFALGNVIFILTSDVSLEEINGSFQKVKQKEEELLAAAGSGWELELAVGEAKKQTGKRFPEWLSGGDTPAEKPKKRCPSLGLSLDLNLNLAASVGEEDATDSSRNSSDLTTEHEQSECGRFTMLPERPTFLSADLVEAVDEAVAFKPVDFGELRRRVSETINRKFHAAAGEDRSLCIDEEALDRVVGAVWFGEAPAAEFDEWADRVLVPGFRQLRRCAGADGSATARLLPDKDGCSLLGGGAAATASLPRRLTVIVEGKSWT